MVTTEFAATTAPSPILTPLTMVTFRETMTLLPIVVGPLAREASLSLFSSATWYFSSSKWDKLWFTTASLRCSPPRKIWSPPACWQNEP